MFRVRIHKGFGHGLRPGTDHDINCSACKAEREAGIEPVIVSESLTREDAQCLGVPSAFK